MTPTPQNIGLPEGGKGGIERRSDDFRTDSHTARQRHD